MKKEILFIAVVITTILSSLCAISANDNVTDSYTTNPVDDTSDVSVSTSSVAESSQDSESNDDTAKSNVDDTSKVSLSSEESLESENSNSLSTDTLKTSANNDKSTQTVESGTIQHAAGDNTLDTSLTSIKSKDVTKYYKGSTKYSATFLNSQGLALTNTNVKISVNGKTYTIKTNSKGVASLAINLKPGTYKVTAQNPITGYSTINTFKILSTISASNIAKIYKDGKRFYARFLKSNGKVLAKKIIKFKIKGKTYKVKTNAKGVARLSLTSLKKGTYKIISYNIDGLTKTNTVKVLATSKTKIVTKTYNYLTTNTKTIKATLLNSLGYSAGKGKVIKIKVNGKTYSAKTNSNGVATIKVGKLKKGSYTIKYKFYRNGAYKASSATSKMLVLSSNNAVYTIKSATSFIKGANTKFKVALTASGIPLTKRTVTINVNNKNYVKTTNSKGIASLTINLNAGTYIISYTYKGESKIKAKTGSTQITVNELTTESKLISVNNIIDSATTMKNYYDTNKKLPNTVSCGGYLFSIPEFSYLMSKALKQLEDSNMADIASIPGVGNAPSPSGDTINSQNLYKADYLTLAQNTASFIETNKRAPNYISTSVGKIIYSEIVDVLSRGLSFYKKNSRLPNYLVISYGSGSTGTGKGLNYKETLTASQIASYLKATKNCQVKDASITKIVASVTKGLTSDYAKANAIFKYVRDKLTYSFYFNTKYGAVKALSNKKGNCVDHTHLIVAMCRNAGIAARYVHGNCKFTSGNTYGHVWAQVYVNGKWYVADATSSRNSFGSIVNWNTNSYKFNNIYTSLPF